ncbi:aspartate/glutamate racemase family protein [Pseudovibrio denitrificans]|uniref:aspartate/glutamate racemase family protein n=1 Tax=Pseudovibrio denitrificans TaxID=258256 RepID=UPI0039BF817F
MTIHSGGQNICGVSIGVLSLESYFPKPPGHIKNPSSLPFTTTYEILHGLTVQKLLADPSPELLQPIISAAKRLEDQGVHAITGSCGFLAIFQKEIAEAVSIPVFVSSLIQVPLAYHMTKAPVGVITASASSLTDKHLEGVGASGVPIVVQGLDEAPEFSSVILRGERTQMDLGKVTGELLAAAESMVERSPEIGAIVLECTDLPPYAHQLQAKVNRPVFDIITLASMVHATSHRMAFPGFI